MRQGERQKPKKDRLAFFTRAEDAARRAIALAPEDPSAHYWLGLSMGRRGQTRGMMKSLSMIGPMRQEMREVLRLNPNHGGAHHVLGEMALEIPRMMGGSKSEAVRELEEAARLEPNVSAHFTALARAYKAAGRRDAERSALEHVLAIKTPGDPAEYDEDVKEAREMLQDLGVSKGSGAAVSTPSL
jgi:tetratricopeptide (TPR) repeat protein